MSAWTRSHPERVGSVLTPRVRAVRDGRNRWLEGVLSEYRAARYAWEQAAEAECIGYATELAEYRLAHPAPTLRAFLVQSRHMIEEEAS